MGKRLVFNKGHRFENTRLRYIRDIKGTSPREIRVKCDCGKVLNKRLSYITAGFSKSCGCLKSEMLSAKNFKHGQCKRGDYTGAYRSWSAMHQRVKVRDSYKNIKICPEWNEFSKFYEDMGDRPKGFTIERINNNKGYYKENCRWATTKEQNNNKSNNFIVKLRGEKRNLNTWCEILNMPYNLVKRRIYIQGWSAKEALLIPLQEHKIPTKYRK